MDYESIKIIKEVYSFTDGDFWCDMYDPYTDEWQGANKMNGLDDEAKIVGTFYNVVGVYEDGNDESLDVFDNLEDAEGYREEVLEDLQNCTTIGDKCMVCGRVVEAGTLMGGVCSEECAREYDMGGDDVCA